MNKDFHYYGTYVAAKAAGFNDDDALIIAHAAQYVDDSSNDKIKSGSGYYITDFTPMPTIQTNMEIFKNYTIKMLNEKLQNETARAWACFHFLPGNYVEGIKKAYTGEKSNSALGDSWTYDKKAEEKFKLLCLPNSEIVMNIINDITYYHKNQKYFLQMLGMRMHSLADTWAHMYHAGISAWFMNDAYNVEELGPDMKPNGSRIFWKYDPFFSDNLVTDRYSCSTASEFYNSFSYLGHGRMGHFPDYGFKRYEYRPNWSDKRIKKDNQTDFLNAFKQMVQAMKCIREGRHFDNSLAALSQNVESAVKKVIATVSLDQTEAWKKAIDALGYKKLQDYKEDAWLNDYKKSKSKESNYYKFNVSAVLQVNLVKDILRRNNIYLDEIPQSHNVKAKIKNVEKNSYFGEAVQVFTYDYPMLKANGIELSFINPSDRLKSGDVVEIRTNESAVSENYPYLMAWETPALYYHAKEFGMNRSKWELCIKGANEGTPITSGKQIYIKNVHFKNKPYLQPYHSYAVPPGDYFTTAASSGQNEQLWTVELTDSTKYYYISCKGNSNVFQVRGGSQDDCAIIEEGKLTGNNSQKFALKSCGDGYYNIQAKHSQKMLDVDLARLDQNTQLIQYHSNNGENQKFKLLDCGDGYCYIIPKHSGKPLKIYNNNSVSGERIVQYYDDSYDYQKFIFEKVSDGRFRIKAAHSGKYLTVENDSKSDLARIIQYSDKGVSAASQIFEMVKLTEPNLYSLKNTGSGLYLDVDCISYEDNAGVIQYHSNGRDNQKFYIFDCDGGYKRIVDKHAGKSLAIKNVGKSDGDRLVQYHQETPEYQKFRFIYAG